MHQSSSGSSPSPSLALLPFVREACGLRQQNSKLISTIIVVTGSNIRLPGTQFFCSSPL